MRIKTLIRDIKESMVGGLRFEYRGEERAYKGRRGVSEGPD